MRPPVLKILAALGATALSVGRAWACPLCHSPTGEKVREGIFNSQFPVTFISMVLPFAVIAGVVTVIHYSSPRALKSDAEKHFEIQAGKHVR